MSTRETVGKIYSDMRAKAQDNASVFEVTRCIGKDYMRQLCDMVERDKLKTDKTFYVEVAMRMNSVMSDVPEYYMISRLTCPTPNHDIAVFQYDRKDEALHFLWTVPSPLECQYYMNNALTLQPEEIEARDMVVEFLNGNLLRIAKKLNGETNNDELIFFRKDENGKPIAS